MIKTKLKRVNNSIKLHLNDKNRLLKYKKSEIIQNKKTILKTDNNTQKYKITQKKKKIKKRQSNTKKDKIIQKKSKMKKKKKLKKDKKRQKKTKKDKISENYKSDESLLIHTSDESDLNKSESPVAEVPKSDVLQQTQKPSTHIPPKTVQLTPQQLIKKYSQYDLDMSKLPYIKWYETYDKPVGAKLTIPELSYWQMVHIINYPCYVRRRRL